MRAKERGLIVRSNAEQRDLALTSLYCSTLAGLCKPGGQSSLSETTSPEKERWQLPKRVGLPRESDENVVMDRLHGLRLRDVCTATGTADMGCLSACTADIAGRASSTLWQRQILCSSRLQLEIPSDSRSCSC